MIFKVLNKVDSKKAMEEWINSYPELPKVPDDYEKIREELIKINKEVRRQYDKDYDVDLNFGIKLYVYLNSIKGFNMRMASNDDFWRYMSLKVVPNLVSDRWGKDNESHFYERTTRIWLRTLWWYIHLSWQGDEKSTLEILKNNTTDEILNLVERAGRKGYYVDVYRNIMYFFSKVPQERKYIKTGESNDRLFRKVMRMNTARSMAMEPELCLGGSRQYVKNIFLDLGEKV